MDDDSQVQQAVEVLCARLVKQGEGLDAVVDLAVLVAGADGLVDERELAAIASTVAAVFHSKIRPEVVALLVRASFASGRTEGTAQRTGRLAALLKSCDAVDEGLAVARAIARSNQHGTPEGRSAIDALSHALGVGGTPADGTRRPWALRAPRPSTFEEIATEWRAARRARATTDPLAWREGITELRTLAAALRDSYLGVTTQHHALADIVEQISDELPERREASRP